MQKTTLPPIFVYGVIYYQIMTESLLSLAEEEQYTIKDIANKAMRRNVNDPDLSIN